VTDVEAVLAEAEFFAGIHSPEIEELARMLGFDGPCRCGLCD